MSLGIMAYQYDPEVLIHFFGHAANLDQRLKSGMQTKAGSRLSTLPIKYTERVLKGHLKNLDKQQKGIIDTSYLNVMKDYFEGKLSSSKNSFMYWYFLEVLISRTMVVAENRTSTLNNSEWYPSKLIPYHKISEFSLYDFEPFEKLDRPDDFPIVLRVHFNKLDSVKKKIDSITDDENQKKQFIEWVEKAKSNKYDLFLFCY